MNVRKGGRVEKMACSKCGSDNVTAASGNATTWYCLKCGHYWTTEGTRKKYEPPEELPRGEKPLPPL
jgi:ribosomal protein L37AE/L43A